MGILQLDQQAVFNPVRQAQAPHEIDQVTSVGIADDREAVSTMRVDTVGDRIYSNPEYTETAPRKKPGDDRVAGSVNSPQVKRVQCVDSIRVRIYCN